jgi:hypothetical protein
MVKKSFLAGFIFCLIFFVGCAAFSYRYYGLADVVYEHGTLLGPKEKDDLPFSKCAPSGNLKHPCVVMFTKEFMAFKQDYLDTQQKLIDCQKAK